jgi:hypothetical protein
LMPTARQQSNSNLPHLMQRLRLQWGATQWLRGVGELWLRLSDTITGGLAEARY